MTGTGWHFIRPLCLFWCFTLNLFDDWVSFGYFLVQSFKKWFSDRYLFYNMFRIWRIKPQQWPIFCNPLSFPYVCFLRLILWIYSHILLLYNHTHLVHFFHTFAYQIYVPTFLSSSCYYAWQQWKLFVSECLREIWLLVNIALVVVNIMVCSRAGSYYLVYQTLVLKIQFCTFFAI